MGQTGAGQDDGRLSPMFYIVFLSLVIPVFFELGSLYMSLSRAALLVMTPVLILQLLSGRFGRITVTDVLIALFMVWFALAIFINNREAFVTFVGSNVLILLGGYLVGRCYVSGPKAFVSLIWLYGLLIVFSLPFALYEGMTSTMVIARFIDTLPMVSSSNDVGYLPRMGIYRVQVVFTHPIHYGLFCSICFSLVMIGLRDRLSFMVRWGWAAVIGVCCFVSVSSGPVLGMAMQIALLCYATVMRKVAGRWGILMGTSAVLYAILEVLSDRPAFFAIIERMTFNSSTAYLRKILLEYGVAQIGRTPLFGVGYNDWGLPEYMTGSLDNYWLLTALVYGMPAFLFLFGAYLYTLIKAGKADLEGDTHQQNLRRGWIISTVGLMFTLATVAVWSEVATITFMMLGSGVWLIHARAALPAGPDAAVEPVPAPASSPYTRFPGGLSQSQPQPERFPAGDAHAPVMARTQNHAADSAAGHSTEAEPPAAARLHPDGTGLPLTRSL